VVNDESAVRRYRPYRRRATVNSQARACSGVNSRSRRQEDSASANVSAVNSTATSASSVRRAKNNRTPLAVGLVHPRDRIRIVRY
jgi:hypothetical protein